MPLSQLLSRIHSWLDARWFAAILLVLGLASVGISTYSAYHDRQVTACQAQFNAAFIEASRERAMLGNADRDSLEVLLRSWSTASDRDSARAALTRWLAERDRIDKERRETPLPDPERARC